LSIGFSNFWYWSSSSGCDEIESLLKFPKHYDSWARSIGLKILGLVRESFLLNCWLIDSFILLTFWCPCWKCFEFESRFQYFFPCYLIPRFGKVKLEKVSIKFDFENFVETVSQSFSTFVVGLQQGFNILSRIFFNWLFLKRSIWSIILEKL